jgi:hypothetical protein
MSILTEFLISGLRLDWELLSDRRRVRRLSLFYSIHNKSAPDYLCDLMPLPVGPGSRGEEGLFGNLYSTIR